MTIEYLTIENFGQTGGNNNEGVVNHDSAANWTIQYNTIEDNAGAGVMMGSNDVVEYNCLTKNGQYGFSSYTPSGPSNITLSHNEISYNDTYNWEVRGPGMWMLGWREVLGHRRCHHHRQLHPRQRERRGLGGH